MTSTLLAPFTARDGENLALYEWSLAEWDSGLGDNPDELAPPPRGVVLMVHGLGEYARRYDHVAEKLISLPSNIDHCQA